MSPEITAAFIGLGAAIFTFFLGRYYERKDRGQRKIIETGVTATELVKPRKMGPISMTVEKAFITGDKTSKGRLSVNSAFNYVIGVSNIGLDDIQKPEIDITLEETASIVEIKVNSDKISEDKIFYFQDKNRPYFRRIIPEYINRKDSLTITVLSINDPSQKCQVLVSGLGITHSTRNSSAETNQVINREPVYSMTLIFAFIAALVGCIFAILPLLIDNEPNTLQIIALTKIALTQTPIP